MDYKIYYRKKKGESTPKIIGKRINRNGPKPLKKDDDAESTPFIQEGGDRGQDEDYIEKRKFCCCCSLKCGIILFGILIILDFFFEIFMTVDILVNENFDGVYGVIYAIIVSVMFVAVVMILYYFCARDSPSSRAVVPWAFLIAAIVNTLLFFWIIIYITAIYSKDKVYITQYEKNDDHDLQEGESAVLIHYKK